jgi:hypothetical protein
MTMTLNGMQKRHDAARENRSSQQREVGALAS